MARRKPILRRYGRLVLDLPDQPGPVDDPRRRRWRWLRVGIVAILVGLIFASATAYGFVTAERVDEKTVLLSEVALANLQSFEGILFQVEYEEEGEDGEESIVLRQVQMFFWPWDDDEEFADDEEADGDEPEVGGDGESNGSMA